MNIISSSTDRTSFSHYLDLIVKSKASENNQIMFEVWQQYRVGTPFACQKDVIKFLMPNLCYMY